MQVCKEHRAGGMGRTQLTVREGRCGTGGKARRFVKDARDVYKEARSGAATCRVSPSSKINEEAARAWETESASLNTVGEHFNLCTHSFESLREIASINPTVADQVYRINRDRWCRFQ